jgi:hypothetical protein
VVFHEEMTMLEQVADLPLQAPASADLPLRLRCAGPSPSELRLLRRQALADRSDGVEDGLVQLRQDVEATDLVLDRAEDLENRPRVQVRTVVVIPRRVNRRQARAAWSRWKNARISP